MLIDGGPGWLGHMRTYAINDPFQFNRSISIQSCTMNTAYESVDPFRFTLCV